MTLDLNLYREAQKKVLEQFIKFKEPFQTIDKTISEYALMSNTPIIAVCYYVGEIKGFTDDLHKMIDNLVKFYKIKEIRGRL